MQDIRPVKNIPEASVPAAEIRDRYRAKEHERPSTALNKKAVTKAHAMEKKKEMPEDLVGPHQAMREKILQMSLFPNIYNKKILTSSF